MNFDSINKVYDYFRSEILPHLNWSINVSDFSNYLSTMSSVPSCKWLKTEGKVFPINYLINPSEFVKKYHKKCVAFFPSNDPKDGMVQIIYQISPNFHVFARLYNWIEQENMESYLSIVVVFEKKEDFVNFYDENKPMRLSGNTYKKLAGFSNIFNNEALIVN